VGPHRRFALLLEKRYNRGDRNAAEEDYSFMGNLPLEGLKVVDIAVLFASPTISQNMGDFGAEVIKVEHPKLGDSLRTLGAAKHGVPLWWKITNRNKKCVRWICTN
jgi:crotonobetainyl-CoA:carnitine CoA-transferase CaiB-like acyl-CoA transferase